MGKIPCIAVFDIGRTNKKFLLFNTRYQPVFQASEAIPDIEDEDGEPCEDIHAITRWMKDVWQQAEQLQDVRILALNFSAHGAGLVHLDEAGKIVGHLYSYIKPFPDRLRQQFFDTYGPEAELCLSTASPYLGMLNSGLQLYWLKYARPELFHRIACSLHLPQYCAYVFTGRMCSEYTSIGCHTMMWDYERKDYHHWLKAEGLERLLAPVVTSKWFGYTRYQDGMIPVGTGLHDSSAALLAYLSADTEPFLLLSTGTWGITLNPFTENLLTPEELANDCLLYMLPSGQPVKASRYFLGHFHDEQLKRISAHFHLQTHEIFQRTASYIALHNDWINNQSEADFVRNPDMLARYETAEQAYLACLRPLVAAQVKAIRLAAEHKPLNCKLYVDGGFTRNEAFMQLLQHLLPEARISTSQLSEGSLLGVALYLDAFAESQQHCWA
ncbi:MAG: hypothetical protein IRZ01_04855 [Thermoflavifilum aggregans]|nr:hypothetical protein [Thermoflavifilum aggregans]